MALVDSYAPCPCGSGEKFKWCCQKAEAVAERAERLFETGQLQAALETVDAALRKDPKCALLSIRKAYYLASRDESEPAAETLRQLLRAQPGHPLAHAFLVRLVMGLEGPLAAVEHLQSALSQVSVRPSADLASVARELASLLGEAGLIPAALAHFELAEQLQPPGEQHRGPAPHSLEVNPTVPPWYKHRYVLADPPVTLGDEARRRFAQALGWAGQGLWSSAAAAFELLAADRTAAPAADLNAGLCRLWLGDHGAAVAALRRTIAPRAASPEPAVRAEAVDLEALCQLVAPPGPDDLVEMVQWIWPLRDRAGLLEALRSDPTMLGEESAPIDPDDPSSPVVDQFAVLDRPRIEPRAGLNHGDLPRILGRVLVGQEIAAVEGYDDGRLDALAERFRAQAGAAIAPAHPRTKVLTKMSRSHLALGWEWQPLEGLDATERDRLHRDQGASVVRDVWPRSPMPYLRGRTPLQAAAAGDAEIPLRAAVFQLEQSREPWRDAIDFTALRAMLKIGPEPAPDPETVDLESLHPARLSLVPAERLSDEGLVELYLRAERYGQLDARARASRLLIDRPGVAERGGIPALRLYGGLAAAAADRGRGDEALDWLRRGRQAEPAEARTASAPLWDMLEIKTRSAIEPPEQWVPELVVVLNRYNDNPTAKEALLLSLLDMGLMRLVVRPEQPDQVAIDPRPLQALLAKYGPRVTTAAGEPGLAASRGSIWTPGGSKAGSTIWTPGSSGPPDEATAPSAGAKPKLIIPGR
jgi:tetratricopeptide (TPR) repeat protein